MVPTLAELEQRSRAVLFRLGQIGALDAIRRIIADGQSTTTYVLGGQRRPNATRARHRAWMVLRHTLGLSYPEIGSLFDADHTTVRDGVLKAEAALARQYASGVAEGHMARLGPGLADGRLAPAEDRAKVCLVEGARGQGDEQRAAWSGGDPTDRGGGVGGGIHSEKRNSETDECHIATNV